MTSPTWRNDIDFERVYETIPGNGWLTMDEAHLLYDSAYASKGDILEVGCYQGRSTVLLASFGRQLACVDPFDGFDDTMTGDQVAAMWSDNIKSRGIHNTTLYRCKIEDWDPVSKWELGFAYLDGDHTYQGTTAQIKAAVSHGARRICVHDYATSGDGKEIVRAIADSRLSVVALVERMAFCVLED